MKKDFKCPGCGADGSREIKSRMCISENPSAKEDILSGEFFEWKCPQCGKRFFIDDVFLYNDDANKFMVYYVPGFKDSSLLVPTVIKADARYDIENSVLRAVSDFVAFTEKIRILEEGLDDKAIEAMKAVYSHLYAETSGEKIYNTIFEEAQDKALSFSVFLEDEDFIVEIPRAAYEQAKKDFSCLFLEDEKLFLRIDQEWLAGVLAQE